MESTIWEDFTLPSKGLVYDKPIEPHIFLRSMTVMEDMKMQSPSEQKFKSLADIVEDCMRDKPSIHVYDMCIADYEFLLNKLRIISYGSDYKLQTVCPKCGNVIEAECDLESRKVVEYTSEIGESRLISLPLSNKNIELKFQTPRDMDIIEFKNKERKKETKTPIDFSELFKCMSLIGSVDGKKLNSFELEEFVKGLKIRDVNYILQKGDKLNGMFGLSSSISATCDKCGEVFDTSFRYTKEFFKPAVDF